MKSSAAAVLVAALQLAVVAPPASAMDGDLDPTFGTRGKVITSFGSLALPSALAVQADGRILIAGVADLGFAVDLAMARYETDGTLDATFGTGGTVVTPTPGLTQVHQVLIQPDGKIVLVAEDHVFATSTTNVLLARYGSDGTLDATFGSGGIATFSPSPTNNDSVADAVLQPDGMIVVAGATTDGGGEGLLLLLRVDGSGALDPTFGSGGVVGSELGGNEGAIAVALQSDGSSLVAGVMDAVAILVRHLSDGTLDTTFGSGGIVSVGPVFSNAFGVVVQPSGNIVVGVGSGVATLKRYDSLGALDTTFGSAGSAIMPVLGTKLKAQPDGRLLVSGQIGGSMAVVRADADGEFDPTVSSCGAALTAFAGDVFNIPAAALAVQPDGRFLIAGTWGVLSSTTATQTMAVARFGTPGTTACSPAASGDARLKLKVSNTTKWKWTGSPVALADFGMPDMGDDHTFCLVDPATGRPRFALTVPGMTGLCTPEACWKVKPTGYIGTRKVPAPGKSRIKLIATTTGDGKLIVTNKNVSPHLEMVMSFPYALPVAARLKRGDGGACWEATFSTALKNDIASGFVAFSD